ncbi:MAG: hypothetical protein ACPH4G_07340 [Henriciella sp.]
MSLKTGLALLPALRGEATITVKARKREDIGYGQTQIIARLGR